MKLTELYVGQRTVVQLVWGEKKIEFFSNVLNTTDKGVYVTAYMHQGAPLELNVDSDSKVECTLFAHSSEHNHRRSWKNVELSTVSYNGTKAYYITTSAFNHYSKHDDRRKHDRVIIHKNGQVYDAVSKQDIAIMVHDISDIGISFYAPPSFNPSANQITVTFEDVVNNRLLKVKVECIPVRTHKVNGQAFWGCRIANENKDFLLYGFLVRLVNKRKDN